MKYRRSKAFYKPSYFISPKIKKNVQAGFLCMSLHISSSSGVLGAALRLIPSSSSQQQLELDDASSYILEHVRLEVSG